MPRSLAQQGGAAQGRGLTRRDLPAGSKQCWVLVPAQSGFARRLGPTSLGTPSFLSRGPAPKQHQGGYGLYCDRALLASTSPPGRVTTSLHCLLTLNQQPRLLLLLNPTQELPASGLGGQGAVSSFSLVASALETGGPEHFQTFIQSTEALSNTLSAISELH